MFTKKFVARHTPEMAAVVSAYFRMAKLQKIVRSTVQVR